jgi:hypothetical protein
MPQLTTSWVQRFGLPLYVTSVGDNDLDFAVPSLRAAGVPADQVTLIGANGNRSAWKKLSIFLDSRQLSSSRKC